MQEPGIHIPIDELNSDTLAAVIEEFVTRDGTDLADTETKRKQVLKGLQSGRLLLLFDPEEGTCNIISANESTTPPDPS